MFTVTMGRSRSVLSAVAFFTVAGSAAAQAPVIVRTNGSGGFGAAVAPVARRMIQISDDSVRSYLARFEPAVLDDESGDANFVTMVLDNDGTYLRSTSRHAKVVEAMPGRVYALGGDSLKAVEALPGRVITINGDSLRAIAGLGGRMFGISVDSARSVVVSSSGNGASIAAVGGTVGSVVSLRNAEAAGPGLLAGLSPDEIGGIATKRYASGEMGKGQIFVTIIFLK